MTRTRSLLALAFCFATCPADSAQPADKPIRALLVTGGCCHDYSRQKLILTKGISARADVRWTVVQQGGSTTNTRIPLYDDPNWAQGFDIVVHNECFAAVKDPAFVDRVLKPHQEGTPAILIHCAMHCYRVPDDRWFRFVGIQSPGHGPHYPFEAENIAPDHPIMTSFGESLPAEKGELYHTVKVFETATPLAHAKRRSDGKPQVCVWTNDYHGTRVFGTTIGHYNDTMAQPQYLDMLARGLLWAVGRDPQADFTAVTDEVSEQIASLVKVPLNKSANRLPQKCCGEGNVAMAGEPSASSEETGKNNFAKHAIDGDLGTRWCAANGSAGATWQVDLGEAKHVRSLRIHWEKENAAYRYRIEASADAREWETIVERSDNKQKAKITPHQVDSPNTRHLRVTFLGATPAFWGSLWEFEAYESEELPELPKGVSQSPGNTVTIADVQAPDGFEVTLFGAPPQVNYPVCLAAAPTGEVFVGVDEQGSLGKEPGGGRVLRCLDTDGDGQADEVNVFAEMDHPRGLFYDDGSLWVLHPPELSVYHDDDRDGVADRHETLVTGLTTDELNKRGADHTTNGIRMGIDGWLYIAVGDFGFVEAKGADGTTLSRRGGGILRVRPDGTEMEVFAWGLRNILDACIDPYMNVFTRDNTNDGGGWDIRLSHVLQSGRYGYPSLYMNFTDEILPPLAQYGGGSGCGGMFLHDLRWPEQFDNAVYTCDWGRNEVYRHNLPAEGATFKAHQETFLKLTRPTDIDVDGSGLMYVSSWKNGNFSYTGPNVGYVAQIRPKDFLPKPFPDLKAATEDELVDYLASPSAVWRLHSQREILRRGRDAKRRKLLVESAADIASPLYGRAAAIFTLKQLDGEDSHDVLVDLAGDSTVREFALRALTDRRSQLANVPSEVFLKNLKDDDPRVQARAVIGLGRLGFQAAAEDILPLTSRETSRTKRTAKHSEPDPGRVIPHLAVRALVALDAWEACLKGLDSPHADGALWALRYMHSAEAVDGLIGRLSRTRNESLRREITTTLVRLYHREGAYKGGWWGTRPDTSGPYFDRKTWEQSKRIGTVLRTVMSEADKETAAHLRQQLTRHKVAIDGLLSAEELASRDAEPETAIKMPAFDKNNPDQIGNLAFEAARERTLNVKGDAARGKQLFKQQSCIACHTYADGQKPKGPHLVDIAKRYKQPELIESLLKPSVKIAQGFDTYAFVTVDGRVLAGFVVSESADTVQIRQTNGLSATLYVDDIDERAKQSQSMMPAGIVNNLTPEQLADLVAYLASLTSE